MVRKRRQGIKTQVQYRIVIYHHDKNISRPYVNSPTYTHHQHQSLSRSTLMQLLHGQHQGDIPRHHSHLSSCAIYVCIHPTQYLSSRLPLRLLPLLSLLPLRFFFLACAFPVSAPMTAPPSVPTPGPSRTSPMRPPAPAPRKLSRDS